MTPPPAVEIRSSSASTTTAAAATTAATASSSLQNPSHDPNFDCRNNLPGNDFQYGIDSGTVFGNGRGFTYRAAPGRARPRLVKVRRQAHGRYRAVSGESSSGFNPFLSSSDCAVPGKVDEFACTSNGGGDGDVGNSNTTSSNGFWEKCGFNTADFSNGSFVFGSSSSSVEAFGFGAKPRECGDNEGKPVSGIESANPGNLDDDGNGLEVKQCPSLVNADVGNVGLRNEVECENQSDTGQEFGGMGKILKSNSNFEDRESRISVEEPDASVQVGISGSSFVFGASWFNPMSSLNKVTEESGARTGNWVSHDTETHKVKDAESKVEISENVSCNGEGNIVFGSGSEGRSSFMGCVAINCTDSVQSNHGSFVAKPQSSNLDSGIDDKCRFTSYEEDHIASASSTLPSFNLPNVMEKLKIDNKNVDVADRKHSSNDDTSFAFRSSKKASALSNGGLGTTRESSSESFVDAARGTGGAKFASGKENAIGSEGASVGISSSESYTFQAGLASSSSQSQVNGDRQSNEAAEPSSSLLTGLHSQTNFSAPEVPTVAEAAKEKNESSSAGASVRPEVPFFDFKQPTWDPSCLKESLFPDSNTKLGFGVGGSKKNRKSKKIRVKLKQPSLSKLWSEQTQVKNLSTAQETPNSPGCCSPMDFSPYEDTTKAEQFSAEATDGSTFINSYHAEFFSHSAVASDPKGELGLGITKDNEKSREPTDDSSGNHHDKCFSGHYEGFIYGAEGANSGRNAEQVCRISEVDVASADKCDAESSLKVQFGFASGLEDMDGRKFFFSASSSEHNSSSTRKHLVKKKYRKKAHCDPFVIAPCPYIKDLASDTCTSQRKEGNMSCSNEPVKQGSISSTATQEACEMWRLRGNQAYKNGDMSKAEDFYTRGIDSVPSNGTLRCCLEPLVICYSNRAATRMSLGNVRGAIKDCARAAALDPNFLKVQMRAANCHLLLGEVNDAKLYFMKCLESGPAVCLDRRITIEAADGLQKAQKVADCTNHCMELLEQRTPDVAVNALDLIAEGLSTSPYSERLLDMKAEFMFMLRKYEEVILLCEQTVYAAERNFVPVGADDKSGDIGTSGSESYSLPRLWRWQLISRSHFYLGRLEVALDLLAKIEQMGSINDKYARKIVESAASLSVTIRNLLHHKNAGNELVQSGKYAEAIEHYTAAISSNVESRPFAAICFCNRAAAHQALGQVADAIADCSLAMALDGNYSKAISRRATLHELIRDYGQASTDLQRLISMLENQSDEKARQSGTPGRSSGGTKELRQARRRLLLVEENAKKEIPLDLYLILGVKESDTAADIKKAYRKAALKHHPDKAGQFLARSESGDEGRLWKDIIREVHTHADRLFKMIGEAYAVLSEPSKRSQYDLDEEIRKATKRHNASSSPSKKSTAYTHPFERSDYGRNWQNWKTHGNSRSRW